MNIVATAGSFEIPLSILLTAGAGLCSAVVYVFHLLIASQERRAKELLEQMMIDRKQAEEAQKEYTRNLESLVHQVTAEHDKTRNDMIATVSANSEAIRLNTAARELSNKQISQLIPEITSVVILKMVEFGVFTIPLKHANKPPERPPEEPQTV